MLSLQRDVPTAAPAQTAVSPNTQADLASLIRTVVPDAKDLGALLESVLRAAGVDMTGSVIELLIGNGYRDESKLTDIAFWMHHPDLSGEKLHSGLPGYPELSKEWLDLRTTVVRPAFVAPKPGASGGPKGMVPADQLAAESGGGGGARYFTQYASHYRDADAPRVWQKGESGQGTCNTASLTMGLVSMASESEVRTRMVALLKSRGMHVGASVQIGKDWVSLAEALDDPKVVNRIPLIDLVTAVAIGEHGKYTDVELPATLARVAREAGLAVESDPVHGQPRLATDKGRALAGEMLAEGKRVLAGTRDHYVYLLEVRDDGAIVHDPAGARIDPEKVRPIFLYPGDANFIADQWKSKSMDDTKRAAAQRRVSTNPEAAAIVNRLVEIWAMPEPDRKKPLAGLAKDHPGDISAGSRNFYSSSEFSAHDLRLVVSLAAKA